MKNTVAVLLCLCLAGTGLTGCAAPREEELAGTVTVGGACAAEWCMTVILESFTFEKTQATVTYSPSSSRYGISGVSTGMLDLGVTSFLPEDMPPGIEATPFAKECIAVLVHEDNPVQSFTTEQLRGILTGEIQNWSELGWEDEEIILFGRRDTSGTRHNVEEYLGVDGSREYHAVFSGSGAVAAQVGANPYAMGYGSYVHFYEPVAYASIDGVLPGYDVLADGSYPLTQTFYLLYDPARELGPTADAFLEYFWRADIDELVKKTRAYVLPRDGGAHDAA